MNAIETVQPGKTVISKRLRNPAGGVSTLGRAALPSLTLFLGFALMTAPLADAETSIYELTVKGKQCQESSGQELGCEYKIGTTLHVAINGIGQTDTGITFMKSDFNGDFYAAIGALHGCVIVKRNPERSSSPGSDYAFISPRTGKVYRTWPECGADR